jgi:hypothetical protein
MSNFIRKKCGEVLLIQWGSHSDLIGYAFRIVRSSCKNIDRGEVLAIMVVRLFYDLKLGAVCLNTTIWESLDKWEKSYLDRVAGGRKAWRGSRGGYD